MLLIHFVVGGKPASSNRSGRNRYKGNTGPLVCGSHALFGYGDEFDAFGFSRLGIGLDCMTGLRPSEISRVELTAIH